MNYNIKFGAKLDTSNINEEIKKVTETAQQTPIELSVKISSQDKEYLNTVKEIIGANQQVQQSINQSTQAQEHFSEVITRTASNMTKYNNDVINTTGSIREFVASNRNMMDSDTVSQFEQLHSVIATLVNEGDIDKLNRYKQELKELKTSFNVDKKTSIVDARDASELNNLIRQMQNLKNTKDRAYQRNPELLNELDQLAGKAKNLEQNFDTIGNRRDAIRGLKTEFGNLRTSINGAQQQTMSLGEQLKEAINKFSVWSGVTMLYFKAIEGIKAMVSNVRDLDSSLTELRKVTDLTDASMERFTERAYEAGVEVGRTGREIIDAMQIFAQAGYAVEDAFDLGTIATMMVNVGDGIENVDDSAKILISTMKGFGMQTNEAIDVVDTLNKVSNTSAISFGDLAEGMTRTSAVMNQADVSIEETSGLLTGANEIMQNIEKSSSGLVTISQRLRGIKEAGDEVTPSLATMGEEFKSIANVDILDEATGQLRSTYDILSDLAEVYPNLTANQQQYLGELAAGGYRQNMW